MIKYRNVNIPVFSIPPNWKEPFRLGESFGDVIFEAISTKEQRYGIQPRPLHSVQFRTLTLSEQETGFIRKAIESAGDMPIAMPLWNLRVKLTADIVIGNSFVYCDDTAGSLFDVAPFCALWRDFDFFETFRTFAIGANSLQVDTPISKPFRADDSLIPLIVGHFKRDANVATTDTIGEFPVDFDERLITPGPAAIFTMTGTDAQTFKFLSYELIGGELFTQISKTLLPAPGGET